MEGVEYDKLWEKRDVPRAGHNVLSERVLVVSGHEVSGCLVDEFILRSYRVR
jgi:hypothetical protein